MSKSCTFLFWDQHILTFQTIGRHDKLAPPTDWRIHNHDDNSWNFNPLPVSRKASEDLRALCVSKLQRTLTSHTAFHPSSRSSRRSYYSIIGWGVVPHLSHTSSIHHRRIPSLWDSYPRRDRRTLRACERPGGPFPIRAPSTPAIRCESGTRLIFGIGGGCGEIRSVRCDEYL